MTHEDFKFGQRVCVRNSHVVSGADFTGRIGGIAAARWAYPWVSYIIILDIPAMLPGEELAAEAIVMPGTALDKI